MDFTQFLLSALSGVFGAGAVWGTTKTKITSNEKRIDEVKAEAKEIYNRLDVKIDTLDRKIDRIVDHLLKDKD